VVDGVAPPESRVPTFRDGTLGAAEELAFPPIPGVEAPRATNRLVPFGDWTDPRPEPDRAYVTLVSRVDADGNERGGIRLPAIAVPTATYTGWNWYKARELAGELCDRDGAYVPFAVTKAERERTGDPRPSLEERYDDESDWLSKLRAATAQLRGERLLLAEDADRIIAAAERSNPFTRARGAD
jgi:alpha/beta hydrolase family protein